MITEQATFDIDAMLAEVNPAPPRPVYTGAAPLHFSTDFYTVDELAESWAEWIDVYGHFDSIRRSHLWRVDMADRSITTAAHECWVLSAALYCDHYQRRCECVGQSVHRAQCDRCRWYVLGSEAHVVESWHDHAWPGWRALPVIPFDVRGIGGGITQKTPAGKWVTEHYPPDWQTEGAPVRSERCGMGTRHVPGYSPWGGYDLADVT